MYLKWINVFGDSTHYLMNEGWGISRPWWHYDVLVEYHDRWGQKADYVVSLYKKTTPCPTHQDLLDMCIFPEVAYPQAAFERMFNMTPAQVARWFEKYNPKLHEWKCRINWIRGPRMTNKLKNHASHYQKEQFLKDELRRAESPKDNEWFFPLVDPPEGAEAAPHRWKKDGTYRKFKSNWRQCYLGSDLLAAVQDLNIKPRPSKKPRAKRKKATTVEWRYFGEQGPLDIHRISSIPLPAPWSDLPAFTLDAAEFLGLKSYVVYPQEALEKALRYLPGTLDSLYGILGLLYPIHTAEMCDYIPGRTPTKKSHLEIINGRSLPEDEMRFFMRKYYPRKKETFRQATGILGADLLSYLGQDVSGMPRVPPPATKSEMDYQNVKQFTSSSQNDKVVRKVNKDRKAKVDAIWERVRQNIVRQGQNPLNGERPEQ